MPQLEHVVRAIKDKKNPPPPPKAQFAASENTLDYLFHKLATPHITPEELDQVAAGINATLGEAIDRLTEITGALKGKPDSLDPVLSAIAQVQKSVTTLANAIMSLKLPDVHVPPFPEIPKVDLSPIMSALDDMRIMILMKQDAKEPVKEEPEERAREWVFDVNRNQAGYIRSINVKEV